MRATSIIINADDLGLDPEVNDAIFELMGRRVISSATMMANAPALRDATARASRFPYCSFGAHLNLTQFEPLTGGSGAQRLVDGTTGGLSRAIETAVPTPGLLRAAYEEWCAQIELLASAGIAISHLDSHNHVHTRPQLFPVLKPVQRRYGIRKVRLAKNLYSTSQPCPAVLFLKKRLYNTALQRVYRTHTTAVFTELLTFADISRAERPPHPTVELMVHPGASYAKGEIQLLESDWFNGLGADVQLITYAQLH